MENDEILALVMTLRAAQDLLFDDPSSAERLIRAVLERTEALRLVCPSVHFMLGGVLRDLGQPELALDELTTVLETDPLDITARSMASDLARELRASLIRTTRAVDDPDIPRLHARVRAARAQGDELRAVQAEVEVAMLGGARTALTVMSRTSA